MHTVLGFGSLKWKPQRTTQIIIYSFIRSFYVNCIYCCFNVRSKRTPKFTLLCEKHCQNLAETQKRLQWKISCSTCWILMVMTEIQTLHNEFHYQFNFLILLNFAWKIKEKYSQYRKETKYSKSAYFIPRKKCFH